MRLEKAQREVVRLEASRLQLQQRLHAAEAGLGMVREERACVEAQLQATRAELEVAEDLTRQAESGEEAAST